MNTVEAILEQSRSFVLEHVHPEMLREAVPFGLVCLVAGIGLSVLGAKLARFGIACAFTLVGGYIGVVFSEHAGFSREVSGLLGALMVGVIGYQTYRLWVGLSAAVVLSLAVLGAFGYQRVMPHVAAFDRTASVSVASPLQESSPFVVLSPDQQAAYRNGDPKTWARDLWTFVREQDNRIDSHGKAIILGAMVTGLCLGVLAVRWALVLSTSLTGTAFVTVGITTLLYHSIPDCYKAFQHNPGIVGAGVGGFLVASLVLQTLLTRSAPTGKAAPA